ncbi:MAG: hypothetical protein KatS3mg102_2689 [Planctomycetota bacterium]|nr:MAG: hypothetical protein KatS3mg102_2689 [Planctomycetota bacterium]
MGRSPGTRIEFRLDGGQVLPVFTTRPDTLGGVTFIALAPEHPLLERAPHAEARAFAARVAALPAEERASAESGRDKEGMPTGLSCTNPLTGERVPIWVASYALMEYGTGAVMGVPAHDQRDFEFARRHGLPIRVVIRPPERELDPAAMTEAYVEPGIMVHTGPEFDGLPSEQGKQRITEWLAARGAGRAETQYRMRDWLISRQRYWGAPIPIVHCARCGEVPVPEQALPVLLPHDAGMEVEVRISGTGRSPLAAMPQWVQTSCPRCGESAERETDTMDTFVDSAWYFLRFTSPHDERHAFSPEAVRHWMPVDQYIGGAEHATKHLIYARFITKVLADLGHLPFDEPFTNLFSQGLICRRAPATGRLEKMSKSKGNVVNPDELIARYGADTQRLYTLFIGPPERDAEWQDDDITGCAKFLQRLWAMAHEVRELAGELPAEGQLGAAALQTLRPEAAELLRKTHETIAKVTHDMEHRFAFNTAVAALMELLNQARAALQLPEPRAAGERQVLRWWCEATVRMLAPMAPHIAEELWQALGHRHDTVFRAGWPEHDPELARPREVEIAVQINGKVRGHERVPADLGREELERRVLASERVQRLLEGRPVRRAVVVPNKLVNLVVG